MHDLYARDLQMSWKMALVSVLVCGGSRLAWAQTAANFPAGDAYTVTSDVAYTTGANGPLLADVYIPSGSGIFPGIVFIHGGNWKQGNRNQMIKLIKALAGEGYVCFTIEYDVDPVHFPASFHESLAALKFFRAHAAEYRLDAAHVAVAGSSAGGELAALVALDPDGTAFDASPKNGAKEVGVQAALIFNGTLDLTAQDETKSTNVADYLGGTCESLPHDCKDASPLFHVHSGAPPFYVGHGTIDQTVPFSEAVAFTNALKAADVPVQFFQAQEGAHTYWADPRFYADNLKAIEAFLGLHLRSVGGVKASAH